MARSAVQRKSEQEEVRQFYVVPKQQDVEKGHRKNPEEKVRYRKDNISYWSKRSLSFSRNKQEELACDQHAVWSDTLDRRITEHFGNRGRGEIRVLDMGTGPGFFAILLCELGYRVTAADYTAAMLSEAKRNAGKLADSISFLQMDAQNLSFPDESFDVIVSRNLTWNLSDPERAYGEWSRVLKPDGLLLNFDANWYSYLYDEEAMTAHLADRAHVSETDCWDDVAGTDVDAMESIARRAPLSTQSRPAWDLRVLRACGMNPTADTGIWEKVWTRDEWINNASTPMFLVSAVKPGNL